MPDHARVLRVSVNVYRALLLVYPKAFRDAYGPLMVQVFEDACRERLELGGMTALPGLWSRTLTDWLTTVVTEWRTAKRQPEPSPTDMDPLSALALSLLIFPGLGQLYNRQLAGGWALIAITAALLFVLIGPANFGFPNPRVVPATALCLLVAAWVWSSWDAYMGAKRINMLRSTRT